jgi:hypothetical protein
MAHFIEENLPKVHNFLESSNLIGIDCLFQGKQVKVQGMRKIKS